MNLALGFSDFDLSEGDDADDDGDEEDNDMDNTSE